MVMKIKVILFLGILFLIGCQSKTTKYEKINWYDPVIITKEPQKKPENKKEENFKDILLKLHNQQRAFKGKVPLIADTKLDDYAQQWSDVMAKKGKLYHSKIENVLSAGKYQTAGENIAWNQQDEEEVVKAWMNSSGHRANILSNSFRWAGFGMKNLYWCTNFGG